MSICKRRDAETRAGDLEVHVAVVVLRAEDVREDRDAVALLDEPHRDARDGLLSGTPASIIARHPPQTLAIEELPFDSMMSETMRIV